MHDSAYDVFFSYRHAHADDVKPLVDALERCGLKVWFDASAIRDFESITDAADRGLAQSKVLLAYYSGDYLASRACQWELTHAFLRGQRFGDLNQRVLVVNPESTVDHIQPVELRDARFRHVAPGDPGAAADLAAAVGEHVSGISQPLGSLTSGQPPWFPSHAAAAPRFVGRIPEMWRIHSALHRVDVAMTSGAIGPAVAQICGLGGLGKTLLAQEYAMRFGAAYPGGVFWLQAYGDGVTGPHRVDELQTRRQRQVREIAVALHLPVGDLPANEVQALLAVELERRGQPSLWIVDDVPSGLPADAVREWFAPHPIARTLLTTRARDYAMLAEPVELDVLEEQDAYALLTFRRRPEGEDEIRAARAIVEDLGRHALATDVSGAALERAIGLQTFAEFLTALRAPEDDVLDLAGHLADELPTGCERNIATTIGRSVGQLGEEGLDFVRLASTLAAAPIPPALVSDAFARVDGLEPQAAQRRALRAFGDAGRMSLVNMPDDNSGDRSVHALVSRAVRFLERDPERSRALRSAAVGAVYDALNERVDDPDQLIGIRHLAAHARALAEPAEHLEEAFLLGVLARLEDAVGDFRAALALNQRRLALFDERLGGDHELTLAARADVAHSLISAGRPTDACDLARELVQTCQTLLGPEHPKTMASLEVLASALTAAGEYANAYELQRQAVDFAEATDAGGEAAIAGLMNLTGIAAHLGRRDEARELAERVLAARVEQLGSEHPETSRAMSNLASALAQSGAADEARKLQESVLEQRSARFGDEHPETLAAMESLAITLMGLGEHDRTEALLAAASQVRWRRYGPEHPSTLRTLSLLGRLLQQQGRPSDARRLQERVLAVRVATLGWDHPATLQAMDALADSLELERDSIAARTLREEVVARSVESLGPEHPFTLDVMKTQAIAMALASDPMARGSSK